LLKIFKKNQIQISFQREIGDRSLLPTLKCIYQLLPIPRHSVDVIVCDSYGFQPQKNAKGISSTGTTCPDAVHRKGLQIVGKEKLSPWEVIEGYNKENVGLKWSWFQAVKVDMQPETIIQQLTRMLPHDHYKAFKRPPMPGENRPDPFLESLQVHYVRMSDAPEAVAATTAAAVTTVEKAEVKKEKVICASNSIRKELTERNQSPRTTKSGTTRRKSTRGSRKSSRSTLTSSVASNVFPGRSVNYAQLTAAGNSMPFGYSTQPLPMNPSLPPTNPYGNQMWPVGMQNPQSQMVLQAPPQMTQYHPRGYAGVMDQTAQSGKQAISAMIRGRHPSGSNPQTMMMQNTPGGMMVATPQNYQQTLEPYNTSMQQVNMQMDPHRQQMVQENLMEQQLRPPLNRTISGGAAGQHMQQLPPPSHNMSSNMPPPGYNNYQGNAVGQLHLSPRNGYAPPQPQSFSQSPHFNGQFYQNGAPQQVVSRPQPEIVVQGMRSASELLFISCRKLIGRAPS
uniref:SP-RING-type domain-containing protein n=1 Tax=Soboliphyme baturini TaxID=241478 RepID=A0A183J5Q6_9BILA